MPRFFPFSIFNSFDYVLRKAKKRGARSVLITWNRGLGDIPLGLYALVYRIRNFIPDAKISFLTRSDLFEGMQLLENVHALIHPQWKRGVPFNLDTSLHDLKLRASDFDLILENPDPTRWVKWQLGSLTPTLKWRPEWDSLHERFQLPNAIGLHVHSETQYGYEKNWPLENWQKLAEQLVKDKGQKLFLFGFKKSEDFCMENVIDLRGETTFFEMLSIIKHRCTHLVVPDSGILSISYYMNWECPIQVVSLWADPRQGVLKQGVLPPNPSYQHVPILAPQENLKNISVTHVLEALNL